MIRRAGEGGAGRNNGVAGFVRDVGGVDVKLAVGSSNMMVGQRRYEDAKTIDFYLNLSLDSAQ